VQTGVGKTTGGDREPVPCAIGTGFAVSPKECGDSGSNAPVLLVKRSWRWWIGRRT